MNLLTMALGQLTMANCFPTLYVGFTRLSPYYTLLLTAPSDYTSVEQRVTFAPEETEQVVTVTTTTDNIVEGVEQFTARLANPSPRVDLNEGMAVVHITDDSSKLLRGTLLWAEMYSMPWVHKMHNF